MDFSTFNLEEGDLFKHINPSTNFYFMDESMHIPHPSFPVPQLTPDGEGAYTNSSALSMNNPDYTMSPLQMNHGRPYHHAYPMEDLGEDEEFFTPLVSPAIGPSYDKYLQDNNAFSPLSSPALHPSQMMNESSLQQKLAFIERQQQQLRNMHNQLRPVSSPTLTHMSPQQKLKQKKPFAVPKSKESPLIKPSSFINHQQKNDTFIAPATPSLLMKLGNNEADLSLPAAIVQDDKKRKLSDTDLLSPVKPHKLQLQSPRALKPLISPSLKPNGQRLTGMEEEAAAALLANKSNYENLKEGKAKSLGIDFSTTIQSGIQNRRSAHKAAEQKRRDTLKQSFDSLRIEIIDALMEEEKDQELRLHKERDVRQMSKVALLQHSYEYILRLKSDNKRKDQKQDKMRQEIVRLRQQLGLPETTPEEIEEERREREEDEMRKEARLKRLSDSVKEE